MNKTERYEKAFELINECCKRDELLIFANNMVGKANADEYMDVYNIKRDNDRGIVEAVNLIGVEAVRDFIEKQLDLGYVNKELEQAYQNGGAVNELHI